MRLTNQPADLGCPLEILNVHLAPRKGSSDLRNGVVSFCGKVCLRGREERGGERFRGDTSQNFSTGNDMCILLTKKITIQVNVLGLKEFVIYDSMYVRVQSQFLNYICSAE